jgi:hypothetical protein
VPSRARAASLGDTSPVARWLAAITVCADGVVVWAASVAEIRRCADGATNLLSVFVPGAVLVAVLAAALVGHDLVIRGDAPQERLPLRGLVIALLLAPIAIACSWLLLLRAPELPCLD